MQENSYNIILNRPRFKLESNYSVDKINTKLKNQLFLDKNIGGFVKTHQIILRVKNSKNEYWNPVLSIRVEKNIEKNISEIRGIFGPKEDIWLFFMFSYFLLGTLIFIFGMLYYVSEELSNVFYAKHIFYVSLFLIIFVFSLAQIGKYKSQNEIKILKNFIIKAIQNEQILNE